MNYVILSADYKSNYKDFWPTVSFFWRHHIGIMPILFMVSDVDKEIIPDEYGLIKKQKHITSNLAFESKIIRLFAPKLFPNDICLISDLDMYPLSKKYFCDYFNQIKEKEFLTLSSNGYSRNIKRYPMCYNMAKGATFINLFNLNSSYEDFVYKLMEEFSPKDIAADEKFLYRHLQGYEHLKKFNREWYSKNGRTIARRRIDRANWGYENKLLKEGHYIDSHFLRPYHAFSTEIGSIMNTMDLKMDVKLKIPKTIHQIWIGDKPMPDKFLKYIETWKSNHSGWEVKLWDNKSISEEVFINQVQIDQCKNVVEKTDLIRYELVYKYGGIYADVDFECYKNLETLIGDSKSFIVRSALRRSVFCNGIFGSLPNGDFITDLLKLVPHRFNCYKNQPTNHKTGPYLLTAVIRHYKTKFGQANMYDGMRLIPSKHFFPYGIKDRVRFASADFSHLSDCYSVHRWYHSWK